jgi:hypothetical protein
MVSHNRHCAFTQSAKLAMLQELADACSLTQDNENKSD